MCPKCNSNDQQSRKGFYTRKSDGRRMQRFRCKPCKSSYSESRRSLDFRLRLRSINQDIFFSMCSGISQRRCAAFFHTRPRTIARRVVRFGLVAKNNLNVYRQSRSKVSVVLLDEMESFEHTKCKPVTIPIAVEDVTRKILSLSVGRIAAKGPLAAISVAKYGKRKCERRESLNNVFAELKDCVAPSFKIVSDQSQHYPSPILKHFPNAKHITHKGARGSGTGQGELKKCSFDPLFYINHTFAMIRENVSRLSKQTWCTSKRVDRLESFLYIYAWFHNLWLDRKKRPVELLWLDGPS